VILSGINMPGMDGLTLPGAIKERLPDLPVVMVTAYGHDEGAARRANWAHLSFSPSLWTSIT
jgi:CheY-like chemotaxis protein